MFNAGAPDKLIRDVTGHRSTALQLYERPTVQQKQAVSRVLSKALRISPTNRIQTRRIIVARNQLKILVQQLQASHSLLSVTAMSTFT